MSWYADCDFHEIVIHCRMIGRTHWVIHRSSWRCSEARRVEMEAEPWGQQHDFRSGVDILCHSWVPCKNNDFVKIVFPDHRGVLSQNLSVYTIIYTCGSYEIGHRYSYVSPHTFRQAISHCHITSHIPHIHVTNTYRHLIYERRQQDWSIPKCDLFLFLLFGWTSKNGTKK